MTPAPKTLSEIREELSLRKSYGYQDVRRDNNFAQGFDAGAAAERDRAKVLVSALEFYDAMADNGERARDALKQYEESK